MSSAKPPGGFSPRRWAEVLADANGALARWGRQAEALGWTVLDVFGVNASAPDARYDGMVLLPLFDGSEVIAIAPDQAKARRAPSGNVLDVPPPPARGGAAGVGPWMIYLAPENRGEQDANA